MASIRNLPNGIREYIDSFKHMPVPYAVYVEQTHEIVFIAGREKLEYREASPWISLLVCSEAAEKTLLPCLGLVVRKVEDIPTERQGVRRMRCSIEEIVWSLLEKFGRTALGDDSAREMIYELLDWYGEVAVTYPDRTPWLLNPA